MPSLRDLFPSSRTSRSPTYPLSSSPPKHHFFRRRTNDSLSASPPPYEEPHSPTYSVNEKQVDPFADGPEELPHSYRNVSPGDPYAALSGFDTVFLIDDSGSMAGTNWEQTKNALSAIVPICTQFDSDGVDIYFLNNSYVGTHQRSAMEVIKLFQRVTPRGATPTGKRLEGILKHYLDVYRQDKRIKPLNIICITDGEPTDPDTLERTIVATAQQLDSLRAKDRQVGIQFFQVGSDSGATAALEELDNCLVEEWGVRDMVDTISWKKMKGNGLSSDGILKAVMGAVDPSLDRRRRV